MSWIKNIITRHLPPSPNKEFANKIHKFHMNWLLTILLCIPVSILCSFDPEHFKLAIQATFVVTYATVSAQIAWGGCPLTSLEYYYRGMPMSNNSLTGMLLEKYLGIEVKPVCIFISLAVLFLFNAFLFMIVY